jgi:hypothetical protein
MRPRRLGNTPIGANVFVTPVDPRTGTSPVTIKFDEVLATGITSIASASSGPPPPDGFRVRGAYYELGTTAKVGTAELRFRDEAALPLAVAQFENGRSTILATTRGRSWEVRAKASSLSCVALLEPAPAVRHRCVRGGGRRRLGRAVVHR